MGNCSTIDAKKDIITAKVNSEVAPKAPKAPVAIVLTNQEDIALSKLVADAYAVWGYSVPEDVCYLTPDCVTDSPSHREKSPPTVTRALPRALPRALSSVVIPSPVIRRVSRTPASITHHWCDYRGGFDYVYRFAAKTETATPSVSYVSEVTLENNRRAEERARSEDATERNNNIIRQMEEAIAIIAAQSHDD